MQNRHGELTIICKAKDLVNHTLQLTNNTKLFPKNVRFTLCQRMQNLSIQILHDIIAANEICSGIHHRKSQPKPPRAGR